MGVAHPPKKGRSTQPHKTRQWGFIKSLRQNSLRKTLVFVVIAISLISVLLVGSISYYRTRSQIESLVASQLFQITQNASEQIRSYTQVRRDSLATLTQDQGFQVTLRTILDPEASLPEATTASLGLRNQLFTTAQGTNVSEPIFSLIFILDNTGNVVATSDSQFVQDNFGPGLVTHKVVKPLLNQTVSQPFYSPFHSTRNNFALITTQTVQVPGADGIYTVYGVSPTLVYKRVLEQAVAFLPGARAFYHTAAGEVFAPGDGSTMTPLDVHQPFEAAVEPVVQGVQTRQPFVFDSYDNQNVLAYVQNLPEQHIAIVLQVPTEKLFGEIPLLDSFVLRTLLLTLVILATLTYIGTSQIVNPLIHLSDIASKFAEGKFQDRAKVKRTDEIGQLANSMNKMAEELNVLYANLEGQVELRSSQLRAASEVAYIATSSSRLDEILSKTVELATQRFALYNTSIYLTDETRRFLTLREMSGSSHRDIKRQNSRLSFSSNTPTAWAAELNQVRYVQDVEQESTYQPDDYLPYSRSMMAIPIAVGSDVLGVMEVHHSQPNGFDADLQFILQTIANQIAGAIQNTRLLETAQVDLEETSQLYRLTRIVTGADSEQVAMNSVIEALPQLPHVSALLSVDQDNLHIQALYDPRNKKLERGLTSIDIPMRKSYEALSQGSPIFIEDIAQPSEFDNILSFFLRRGCQAAAILPCMQTGKPAKVLVIGFLEDQSISQATLQPYINLSEVIGATLDKFNLLSTLQHRLAELQVLATFSQATSSETNLQQLYRTLHQLVTDTLGENIGFILALHNPERQLIEFPFAYEHLQRLELDPMPLGNGLTSLVIENRKPLLLTNETERRAVELGARIIGRPAKSWLGVPLITGGRLLGALVLQDQDEEERFSQDDLNLLMTIAPQIATAIRNAQLVEEMQAALKTYEQDRVLFNTWLARTPDSIIAKDVNGTYIRTSHSASAILPIQQENLDGKSDFDLYPQEIASKIYEMDRVVIESGEAHLGDIEQIEIQGKLSWQLVSRIPVNDPEGGTIGLIVIRRDITEMVKAETYARERTEEIRTTAEIARDAAGILDLDELLNRAVNLIRERFGFYHASVFLLDQLAEYAILRESTGEAGAQMKQNQHRLAVGSRSIVGQSTSRAEAVIVPDVTADPNHFPNPLLPNTRAELAIPLVFTGKVIGALDVQSEKADAFTQEDIEILGILADQLAATIHNAELFARAQAMLGKHRLLHQINVAATSASNLQESLAKSVEGLFIAKVADHISVMMLNPNDELEMSVAIGHDSAHQSQMRIPLGEGIIGVAAIERRPVRIDNVLTDPRYIATESQTRSELALPIVFGERLIGVLNLEADQLAAFDENDQEIMAALANNLGAIISNWHLVEQIRRQVDRQQVLFEATSKIRRSVDIQTILQTSIAEIGRNIGVRRAQITLMPPETEENDQGQTLKPSQGGNGHHPGRNGKNSSKESS